MKSTQTAYDNIRYIAFRDTYGSADANYYYQQRWNAHDQEDAPLVCDLLGEVKDESLRQQLFELFRIEPMLGKKVILLSSGELRKFQLTKTLLTFLHRYLVIELKDTEFMPEYIGKLNFYCSAVDDILCREGDNRTIGLLLCKSKDRIKAEYALRDIQKPIGISDYELGQALPKDFRGSLPTIEEIEKELESNRE